jgi:hypothetical protein
MTPLSSSCLVGQKSLVHTWCPPNSVAQNVVGNGIADLAWVGVLGGRKENSRCAIKFKADPGFSVALKAAKCQNDSPNNIDGRKTVTSADDGYGKDLTWP